MIREKFQFKTPSTGAILRDEKERGTEVGIAADEFTRHGQLVPDKMVVAVMRGWIEKNDRPFVLDGFPRSVGQADALQAILEAQQRPLQAAISLDVDFKTIEERVTKRLVCTGCGNILSIGWHVEHQDADCPRCGGKLERRKDDTLEVLAQRMIEYREKSEPLMAYYEERGILFRLNANRPADQVFVDIAAILEAA